MKKTNKFLSVMLALAMVLSTVLVMPISAATETVVYVSADGTGAPSGATVYTDFTEAMEAVKPTTGDVVVRIIGTVKLNGEIESGDFKYSSLLVEGYGDNAVLKAASPSSTTSIWTAYYRVTYGNRKPVTFRDLTYDANGISSKQGFGLLSLHYVAGTTATFERVTFTNSQENSYSTIYAATIQGSLYFKDCIIENCGYDLSGSSSTAGAFWVQGYKGTRGNIYFDNCTFQNNRTKNWGHLVELEYCENAEFTNCKFIDNNITGQLINNLNYKNLVIKNMYLHNNEGGLGYISSEIDGLCDVTYSSEIADEDGAIVYDTAYVTVMQGADSTLPFSYWKDQNGNIYPAGSSVKAQGVTLTAVYGAAAPTDSYTLTYKNTAASSDNETVASAAADNNVLTVKDGSAVTDKDFLYWTDGTRKYLPGSTIMLTKDTTLTAVYYDYYKLTYVNDYVSSDNETVEDENNSYLVKDTERKVTDNDTILYFQGWTDGKNTYNPESRLNITKDTTLTAVYSETVDVLNMERGLFDTLQEAVDAAPAGEKVSIKLSGETTGNVSIPADKDIVLVGTANDINIGQITVDGKLELQGAWLKCTDSKQSVITANTGSKVVITRGNIGELASNQRVNAITNNGGEVIINGGTLTSFTQSSTDKTRTLVNNAGAMTVNDGTIQAKHIPVYVTGGTVTIKGGTFSNESASALLKKSQYLVLAEGGTLDIKGGAFDLTNASNKATFSVSDDAEVIVRKGSFAEALDASYLADSAEIVSTDDITYPYAVQSTLALPEDAATLTMVSKDGGYYTDEDGVQTGILRYISKIEYAPELKLESVGTKFIPLSIFDDEDANKTWADVKYTNVADFESGDTFSADLLDIQEEDFDTEYVALSYATFEDYADTLYTDTTSVNATNTLTDSKDLGNKRTLVCDENGDFTILVVSDPQYTENGEWTEAKAELEKMIADCDPDFIFIDGDIAHNNNPEMGLETLVSPMVENDIPWALTNGNHDHPHLDKNFRLFASYDGFLGSLVPESDPNYNPERPLNFVLPVYANDGETIVFAMYSLDSGNTDYGGYSAVTKPQVKWYQATSDAMTAANGGTPITSIMCSHIPATEKMGRGEVLDGYAIDPVVRSGEVAAQNGLIEAIQEQGDVKLLIHGHDHNNNFIVRMDGFLEAYAGKLSSGSYGDTYARGGRVIKFNQANPEKFTVSWIPGLTKDDVPAGDIVPVAQPARYPDGSLVLN